jgi:hypothetical protein
MGASQPLSPFTGDVMCLVVSMTSHRRKAAEFFKLTPNGR